MIRAIAPQHQLIFCIKRPMQ